MKKRKLHLGYYFLSLGLLVIGLGWFFYAMELVSVPHVREYSDGWWALIGLIIAAVGLALGAYQIRKSRKARKRPATSITAAPTAR